MKRLPLIAFLVGAALAVAPIANARTLPGAVADDSVAASQADSGTAAVGMSAAEHRALMIRSEALNQRYGNAVTSLTPAQFKSLYLAGGDRLSSQELVALVTRSEALNGQYGNPATNLSAQQFKAAYQAGLAAAEHATPAAQTTVQSDSTASGPNWGYVGIAILGAMLLALGSVTVTRRRHQLGF